jgi:hypothetical protein
MFLTKGLHRIHLIGYNINWENGMEATYTGPDTYGVRTVIGSTPFFYACDPRAPMDDSLDGFRLCTYQSEPTSTWTGDCTPTAGIAHPRFPGPCGQAIGTVNNNFNYFSGDYETPVLGSANELWVRIWSLIWLTHLGPGYRLAMAGRHPVRGASSAQHQHDRTCEWPRGLEDLGAWNARLQGSTSRGWAEWAGWTELSVSDVHHFRKV